MLIIFYQFGSDHHHVTIHPLDSPPISSGYSNKHLDIVYYSKGKHFRTESRKGALLSHG